MFANSALPPIVTLPRATPFDGPATPMVESSQGRVAVPKRLPFTESEPSVPVTLTVASRRAGDL